MYVVRPEHVITVPIVDANTITSYLWLFRNSQNQFILSKTTYQRNWLKGYPKIWKVAELTVNS